MDKFETLFNEFMKMMGVKPLKKMSKIQDIIAKFRMIDDDEKMMDAIDEELGEPNIVETYEEDGIVFKRMTWFTDEGEFVKLAVDSVTPEFYNSLQPEVKLLTLEEQLTLAEEEEDYELAIKLRDKINAQKKANGAK
jgi:hypothetical protein